MGENLYVRLRGYFKLVYSNEFNTEVDLITINEMFSFRHNFYHVENSLYGRRFAQLMTTRKDLFDLQINASDYLKKNKLVKMIIGLNRKNNELHYKKMIEDFVFIFLLHISECVSVTMSYKDKLGNIEYCYPYGKVK